MSATPIRLLIADGHPSCLEGLRTVLGHLPALQVVKASDGMETFLINGELGSRRSIDGAHAVSPTRFDRAVEIPGAGRPLKGDSVSSSENKESLLAMKLGCSGILSKDWSIGLIEKSIQKVFAGEIWLDSDTMAAEVRSVQFAIAHGLSGGGASTGEPEANRKRRN